MLTLTLAGALLCGCSSTGYKKSNSAATGLMESARLIEKGQAQRDVVLASLNDLISLPQATLEPQYKNFCSALKAFDATARNIQSQTESIKAKGAEYFKEWDEQLAAIQNQDIKQRSAARKAEVSANFAKMQEDYISAGQFYTPFITELKDIQTALGADLTAGGIQAIKPAVNKVNRDAVPLRGAADQLLADFKSLGISMSTAGPQPAS